MYSRFINADYQTLFMIRNVDQSLVINQAKKERGSACTGSIILAINQGLPYSSNAPSLVNIGARR